MAQEVKRIEKEFIFKTLSDEESKVSVHIKTRRYEGKFSPTFGGNKVSLILQQSVTIEEFTKRVTLFFLFRNQPMTCKCTVLTVESEKVVLELPEKVYRDLGRSYERVQPDGNLSVSIILDGQTFKLDFPSSESYYEASAPPAIDMNFDPTKIAQIIQGFREKAKSLSTETKIIMFRERKQETVQERLISMSGKALLLPFEALRQFTDSYPKQRGNIITQDDVTRLFREIDMDPMTGVNTLRAYMNKRKTQKIWQECYFPILYKEYVVGYILVIRGDNHTGTLHADTFEYITQFTRLLAYSLKQNGYFKEIPVRSEFTQSEIIDISGSGMLFSYPLDGPELNLFMDIDVKIHTDSRVIPINGRIMRLYKDSNSFYAGLQFLELTSKDHQYLLSYIYGSDYDGKIEVSVNESDDQ